MNGTKSITSPLAALALAHGFVLDRGDDHRGRSKRIIYVDFGRLSLRISVKAKEKPNPVHASRADGFWGSLSEQVAFAVLAIVAIFSGTLFFVQSLVW